MPSAWWITTSRRRCSRPWWTPAPGWRRLRRAAARRWRPPAPDAGISRGGRATVSAAAEAPVPGAYDEAFAGPGRPRPHYAQLLGALAEIDLAALRDDVNERVRAEGI